MLIGLDLGLPEGREAGFRHPAVTNTVRGFASEITIEPDSANGLRHQSVAQGQHIRAVSPGRVDEVHGNVGPTALNQIRDTPGLILDIPT